MKRHILTLLTAIAILVLSAMPVGSFPEVDIPNVDKPVHFLMYAFFTVTILLDRVLFQKRAVGLWYLYAPLIAMAYGGAMEIMQHFLGWRSCSVYDFIANDIGAVIGTAFFALAHFIVKRNH